MANSARRKPPSQPRKLSWCCSLSGHPPSPENPVIIAKALHKKHDSFSKPASNSLPGSPLNSKSGLNFVVVDSALKSRSESFRGKNEGSLLHSGSGWEQYEGLFDVRLNLRGKKGGALVLETSSEVLIANSEVFAGLISEYRQGLGSTSDRKGNNYSLKMCRIEVPDVENLGVFRDTIELMFEDNITKRLLKIGVYRAIDILEVSAGIMFTKGVSSCLKYLEAVPWTEEEEEKLRDANARNELKSLVKGLFSKSSIYEKDQPELNKEDLYVVCQSCLSSLGTLLEEASNTSPNRKVTKTGKTLIERISRQVDNINWLLEMLLDQQMGEEFVDMWADQGDLLRMHESTSPMVRYELSRVSATLFIAMGTRKLHCRAEARAGLFQAWFHPMLADFGWLQRCKKGLDMKALEEAMGQTLLTLPLKQQYMLFMEWFRCFSKHGTECPNLSRAFQIWWRRSFLRGSETYAIESR
ncbi:hypothetical protein GH714_007441 [Hevea brasiliensis]|uniref:At3g05675-like ankyrin-like domain-containing protein n=1 Tax=Hevea brasiliensis TaxID=3981 RepID=A0A6A6KVK9_HEVBR|nr:hypothetical protein GH714_007441 [Hevea brasiliensis]